MSVISGVSSPSVHSEGTSAPVVITKASPLNSDEREQFAEKWARMTGQDLSAGRRLAETLPPHIARRFLSIPEGSSFTTDQIKALFVDPSLGLTPEIIDALIDGPAIQISSSTMAQIFLLFSIFSYTASNDVKVQLKQLLQTRKEQAFSAADHAYQGAFTQFIVSMVAAGVTMGMGALYAKQTIWPAAKTPRPNEWLGPIGATQFTQPLNAGGEFANATGQLESARDTATKEESDSLFSIMQDLLRDLESLGRGASV